MKEGKGKKILKEEKVREKEESRGYERKKIIYKVKVKMEFKGNGMNEKEIENREYKTRKRSLRKEIKSRG